MIGTAYADVLYASAAGTQQLNGAYVTTNTFRFLGVEPLLGRCIAPDDGKSGAVPVFLMNYKLWQEQFHGDRKMLGATFSLNGAPRTLVGIMPSRFQYFGADVWLPLSLSRSGTAKTGDNEAAGVLHVEGGQMYLVAEERRKAGVSLQATAADLNVIAQRFPYASSYSQHAMG